ncbi:MAG: ATP-grasp domain-containing protein [Planctomycetota bacterium]|jgi:D-alanine-D-alanine ligase
MKVAVVYNRESQSVINLFGSPNKEKIGLETIKRITDALKQGGHQVTSMEGDKDLVDKLEDFMPRVVKHERPGMVFNVSYGIQGQARYTHIPSILEMVGVPYVASGPLAHSLALDKVVAKMILRQHGIPTPDFAVLDRPDSPVSDLPYPMIVKPKNESVSFGIKVVNDEKELRVAAGLIYDEYQQAVLAEQYIEGREVNVGLLGNGPPEALPPVELLFGSGGPSIYTFEDKTGQSGRTISHRCPADIGDELLEQAKDLAIRAFTSLGCYDCARVDMRLDHDGQLYILEINSLPSLGEHGSYLVGAEHVGLDFAAVINRLVESASARYFGTPEPPTFDTPKSDHPTQICNYITQRRDDIEKRLREWIALTGHTNDPIGVQESVSRVSRTMKDVGLKPVSDLTDERSVWTWESRAGLENGTLLIAHLDVPVDSAIVSHAFRREPEWLFGDGIGSSRAPVTMLEFALRALRSQRLLRKIPVGVLLYCDEGRDARYSERLIKDAAGVAKDVLVLRPGNVGERVVTQRRGQRKYRLRVEGPPDRPGKSRKKPETLRWVFSRLEEMSRLTSQKDRVSVSCVDIRSESLPMLLPHRITATILMTFPDTRLAGETEKLLRAKGDKRGPKWELERISDRPPMKERRATQRLLRSMAEVAAEWEIPMDRESSVWPSVAGLVPTSKGCLCGLGPVAKELGTPNEAVQRISLVQRTLLLAQYLLTRMD